MEIVGLDLGRRNIKAFTGSRYLTFSAFVGEWRDIKLKNNYGAGSFEGVYKGERFFAGSLAEHESEFARQMLTDDKAHQDALLLALIALFNTGDTEFDIVTGLPVNQHDDSTKKNLIELLEGSHELTLNGKTKVLNINRVRVSVEGGGSFWANPHDGLVRLIDGGSKTINYVTMLNRRYVDRDSGTLPFGFDTNKSVNIKQMMNRIAGELGKKWGKQDRVLTAGGQAKELVEGLREYFPLIETLQGSKIVVQGEKQIDLNLFSNAVGYYNIGRTVQ